MQTHALEGMLEVYYVSALFLYLGKKKVRYYKGAMILRVDNGLNRALIDPGPFNTGNCVLGLWPSIALATFDIFLIPGFQSNNCDK